MEEIAVSIYCLAYNQEGYIKQCLDSLLNQKTSFNYIIIVHDDASTDNTPKIIKEYSEKYPEKIIPIFQKENQYSKGKKIVREYIYPCIKGKYLAICEGDDYWTSEYKLQKQFDVLENTANCSMCVHSTNEVYENGESTGRSFPQNELLEGKIQSKDFIKIIATGYSFHTSSYFLRIDEWKKYILNPPSYKIVADVGDEPLQLYFSLAGDIYYINEYMSDYRRGSKSSWSSKQARDFTGAHSLAMYQMLNEYDKCSEFMYSDILIKRKSLFRLQWCVLNKSCSELIRDKNVFNALSFLRRIFCLLASVFPNTMKKYYINRLKKLYKNKGY